MLGNSASFLRIYTRSPTSSIVSSAKSHAIKWSVLFYTSIKFLFGYPWITNNQLIWPPLFIYVHMMCLILRPICQENEKLCFVLPLSTRSSSCATISEWVQHVLTIKIEEGTHCIVVYLHIIYTCAYLYVY